MTDDSRNSKVLLNGPDDGRRALSALLDGMRRSLCLYTPMMQSELYNDPEVLTAIRNRVTTQPKVRFYLLLPSVRDWRGNCPGLARLSERLSTALLLRIPNRQELPDRPELGQAFAIADERALLRFSDPRRLIGEYDPQPNERTKELLELFRAVWDRSEPDPDHHAPGL